MNIQVFLGSETSDDKYKIVIGASDNTECLFFKTKQEEVLASAPATYVLDYDQDR